MSNRTRSQPSSASTDRNSSRDDVFEQPSPYDVGETTLNLDDVTEDDLDAMAFEDDDAESDRFWNATTLAGLSFIVLGIVYLLNEIGVLTGPDVAELITALPWIGGVLVILLGFGLLSWRPSSTSSSKSSSKESSSTKSSASTESASDDADVTTSTRSKRKLMRSRTNKKVFGVCGGIAEYLNLDPTLVRIAFVIGVIASGGPFFLAYFGLAFVMPKSPRRFTDDELSIIRES